jgi:hypothetical protein
MQDNHIKWSGEAPQLLTPDRAARVHVTLLERVPVPNGNQGQRMAAALEKLAASQALAYIPDPAAWEREMREDRPLPGRE